MSSVQATRIRKGMLIKFEGTLCRVLDLHHITPGNKRAHVQCRMRDIRNGRLVDFKFRAEEDVERATLDERKMQFLYREGDLYHFMNTETYEQIGLSAEDLGDAAKYLLPNVKIMVEFFETTPLGVALPKTLDLTVTETAPGLKSATVTNALKPATTETGLVVPVPNFIDVGDVIRVDTETGAYVSRAKGD